MRKSIDAKGLACPQPVILCRKAMAEPGLDEIEVIVDNEAARENVVRFLRFTGAANPVVASQGTVHAIRASVTASMRERAQGNATNPACEEEGDSPEKLAGKTIFLSSDQIGRGDETLGRLLMRGLLNTLGELASPPRTILFMNSGVRLAAEQEEAIELLRKIESRGVELLVCGTCLDYYHLVDRLRVGRISNMYEIAEKFLAPGDVVTLS